MKNGRLGLRLEANLLEEVKVYASKKNVTVSSLVQRFLEELVATDKQSRVSESMDVEQV